MLNINHLKEVGQNYFQHLLFAVWICIRLGITMTLLLIHALLPFIQMPKALDVGKTSDFLFDRDYDIRVRMMKVMDKDASNSK
jgi:hypothetical protein